ncbi:MAG: helix-turn-helix transcriptional regulator [Candidatus Eremiobacteraeota bacterium]|nr:helix-turn-helix transcriptional regulator [Candidatus Eremiobacteraeota bacterium]
MKGSRRCRREGTGVCSCEMGNLYRFVEPIVLTSIARCGEAHGYSIAQKANELAVTHAGLDMGAVYRTLHRLELSSMVVSAWSTAGGGAARRIYRLTPRGERHIIEWAEVIDRTIGALSAVSAACRQVIVTEEGKRH